MGASALVRRPQSTGEEIANSVSHGVGLAAALVAMPFLILHAARSGGGAPLWLRMAPAGFAWLVARGLAYAAGVAFHAAKHLRYGHFVWHLFVLAGTLCHFVAVRFYAA